MDKTAVYPSAVTNTVLEKAVGQARLKGRMTIGVTNNNVRRGISVTLQEFPWYSQTFNLLANPVGENLELVPIGGISAWGGPIGRKLGMDKDILPWKFMSMPTLGTSKIPLARKSLSTLPKMISKLVEMSGATDVVKTIQTELPQKMVGEKVSLAMREFSPKGWKKD